MRAVDLLAGDCRELVAALEPESIDSCVTDPPYGLKFMGQRWDGGVAFEPETWKAVFRVLKPGAHLVAFGGTRTYHRLACAIEDAGFEIRDQLAWVYGSGFPKSHNRPGGLGTALKPAWEPICLARKPLAGTVAENLVRFGTGALNIDGCRIETSGRPARKKTGERWAASNIDSFGSKAVGETDQGRWPANLIHDGSDEVLAGFPDQTGANGGNGTFVQHTWAGRDATEQSIERSKGSAARFFYCAKASPAERHAGCEDLPKRNKHPTVKPVKLMRWLVRLVTPVGGTVLDPFAGSGSTLIAAELEGFASVGCELSPDYVVIAERRLRALTRLERAA